VGLGIVFVFDWQDVNIYLHENYIPNPANLSIYSDIVTLSTNFDLNVANVGSVERAR
jgi:hypothetical protein